jgi:hypothetical protein
MWEELAAAHFQAAHHPPNAIPAPESQMVFDGAGREIEQMWESDDGSGVNYDFGDYENPGLFQPGPDTAAGDRLLNVPRG